MVVIGPLILELQGKFYLPLPAATRHLICPHLHNPSVPRSESRGQPSVRGSAGSDRHGQQPCVISAFFAEHLIKSTGFRG